MSAGRIVMLWFPREFRVNYEAEITELLSREASVARRTFDTLDLLWGAARMQVRVTVRNGATRLWRIQRFSAMAVVVVLTTLVVAAPLTMSEQAPVFTRIQTPHSAVPNNCAQFDSAGPVHAKAILLRCYR